MNKDTFIDMVTQMREAQTQYFKSRDTRALQRAKLLEGVLDNMLHEYNAWVKSHPRQRDLFDT